jgi:hypothetical protein
MNKTHLHTSLGTWHDKGFAAVAFRFILGAGAVTASAGVSFACDLFTICNAFVSASVNSTL